jgi:hypothetical protein
VEKELFLIFFRLLCGNYSTIFFNKNFIKREYHKYNSGIIFTGIAVHDFIIFKSNFMETKNNNTKQPAKGNQKGTDNKKTSKINFPEAGDGKDWGEDPEKKKEIGDDPAGTERKIPRMKN